MATKQELVDFLEDLSIGLDADTSISAPSKVVVVITQGSSHYLFGEGYASLAEALGYLSHAVASVAVGSATPSGADSSLPTGF